MTEAAKKFLSNDPAGELFTPITVGRWQLPHRVAMAPMTRSRAGQPGNVPTDMMTEYYRQRAGAALIITEATQVSATAQGYAWTPGIHTAEQVEGWKKVTDAVHREGGKIVVQLWHVGRISHRALQPGKQLPVAPSAIKPEGNAFIVDDQGNPAFVPFETPRALDRNEIHGIVADFVNAARNAIDAGFDGVEIHSANGYLLDQFLNTASNQRDDEYGGTIANRARLTLQVVDAVLATIGADRVGVRISPMGHFNSMGMDDPEAMYSYLSEELNKRGLAYLHVISPRSQVPADSADKETGKQMQLADRILKAIRSRYDGVLMLAGGFDRSSAETSLASGEADLLAFGKPFLANPDLPKRLQLRAALNEPNPQTFYGGGASGYTDYPFLVA
ncbi:alkene reductase [Permianibacter sp. IMCC34836]|uniref:alkene reductase n=1 Tax=Permianibacter fluminis TaxID=2738515 RepID=UPI001553B815|nr:alkene reductase [Permianibacter fluminis]NQD38485.1 alkene reductase [Permianibacter fluminis]